MILFFMGLAEDAIIEAGEVLFRRDPKKYTFQQLNREAPIMPSDASKKLLSKALKEAKETGETTNLLKTIFRISEEENLDFYRVANAMFSCTYLAIKRYSKVAYNACKHLLGL